MIFRRKTEDRSQKTEDTCLPAGAASQAGKMVKDIGPGFQNIGAYSAPFYV